MGRDLEEHPVKQAISSIVIWMEAGTSQELTVGLGGVTRIEATQKSGLHANLPYVRVWKGDDCHAEFCQHNIVGVYFKART